MSVQEYIKNASDGKRPISDHAEVVVCSKFCCDIRTCAYIDCAGSYGDVECGNCARCAICVDHRKCAKQRAIT